MPKAEKKMDDRPAIEEILSEVIADAAYRPDKDFLLNHPAFQELTKCMLTLEARLDALEGGAPAETSVEHRLAALDARWRQLRRLQLASVKNLQTA
jgi:hypothetical protein